MYFRAYLLLNFPALLPSDSSYLLTEFCAGRGLRFVSFSLHLVQIPDNLESGEGVGRIMWGGSGGQSQSMRLQQLWVWRLLEDVASRIQSMAGALPLCSFGRQSKLAFSGSNHCFCCLLARSHSQYSYLGIRACNIYPAWNPHQTIRQENPEGIFSAAMVQISFRPAFGHLYLLSGLLKHHRIRVWKW